jgi:hypothetical protein
MTAANVVTLNTARRVLREIEVLCPAWSPDPVRIREPTVRDYMRTKGAKDDQERSLIFLASMVLDANGNSVGEEAIMDAPLAALSQLSSHVNGLIEGTAEPTDPLT